MSHPYKREFGGWRCVEGYAGFPVVTCGTDVNCNPQLKLLGLYWVQGSGPGVERPNYM